MANSTSPSQIHTQIGKLINSSRFNEAFLMLKSRLQNFPALSQNLERLKSAESTYKYLIDYIVAGHNDPSRTEMVDQIREALMHANDVLLRESRLIDSPDLYSSTRRMETLRQNSLKKHLDNFIKAFHEDNPEGGEKVSSTQAVMLDALFNYVWTMSGVNAEEYEELANVFDDENLPEYLKLSVISALILSSVEFFDPETIELLLNLYENNNSIPIKAKAITGVLLLSLIHAPRLKGNINLRSRLMLTMDDEDMKKIVKEVLLSILRTYDTQRIDSKMREEVIPELMKVNPEIIDKMRNLASDSEDFLSDENPDWEEVIANSGIGDKLKEINDLQLEGADVMVTAFSHLKSFPFFSRVSNWFLPFNPEYFEFESLPLNKDSETASRLTAVMCESDLHSFLLSLKSMPKDKADQMLENMEAQMKQAKEALSNAIGETDSDILANKIKHTLQDLYRFFKFFRKKEDFIDPFGKPFLAYNLKPLISAMGISSDDIRIIGEFYFQKKYFFEASDVFELYDTLSPGDFSIWEKIGYSYDQLKDYNKAISWYKKAHLINPDNKWLNKSLAIALKNAGNTAEALPFYETALQNEPENYHLLMSLSQCLIDNGQPDEALKHLYHAQYLKPEKKAVLRALAWSELLNGNFEKAGSLYEKLLLDVKADKSDFLNAAHCAIAKGDFKNSINLYKNFIDATDSKDIKELVLAFRDDTDSLKKIGVTTEDLRIIVDKIRYDKLS